MSHQQSFNDSFNARSLDYDQIAKTFVVNDQYSELLKNNHSLLMGPRGSGKTTLLKMMTTAGHHFLKKAHKNLTVPPFTSIYIPSDVQWKKQMEHFYSNPNIPYNKKEIISRFLVSTNIILCVTNTFRHLIEFEFKSKLDIQTCINLEAELCKYLIGDFDIEERISLNLLAIQKKIDDRIKYCNRLINKLRYSSIDADVIDQIPEVYYNDYFTLLSNACTSFEHIFCNGNSRKWALCFDELEISPQWLQFELIDKLRSVDQRFYFKLVTSPIISLVEKIEKNENINASENEDYKIIRTWNYDDSCTSKWNEFSKKLTNNKLKALNFQTTPEASFGITSYDRNLRLSFNVDETLTFKSKYDKGNYYWQVIKELAIIDSSFNAFLARKGISINNPSPKSTDEKDKIFRKILPIVVFRYQFNNSVGRRSRKNPALFYGIPFLYEICDGNPRFLMNLLDLLISNLRASDKLTLDINKQSSIVEQISHKYIELIKAHPDANREVFPKHLVNLGDIINHIGLYFRSKLLFDEFTMDPVGAFVVDDKVSKSIISLIELGVHLGALIYLDPDEGISKKGIVDKKLRLCYLLHPMFDLPKREYNAIKLSTILYKGQSRQLDSQLLFEL